MLIEPAAGGWPRQVTAGSDPVNAVRWSPAGDWLAYSVLPGGGLNAQIYVARPDGSAVRRLTDDGKDNNWLGEWTDDGRFLTITSNRRSPATMDVYLVEPSTGRLDRLADLEGVGDGTSRDGRRLLLTRLRNRGDNDLYLLDRSSGKETRLTPHQPPSSFSGALAPGSKAVYLSSNEGRDLTAFARSTWAPPPGPPRGLPRSGRHTRPHPGARRARRRRARRLYAQPRRRSGAPRLERRRTHRVRIHRPRQRQDTAGPASARRDLHRLRLRPRRPQPGDDLLRRSGTSRRSPPRHRLRPVPTAQSKPHPGVDLATLTIPELVRYPARDGLPLSAWLYRPKGVKGKAPYVLSFHGGPEAQERPGFRSNYQALLARGIGVLARNVRGSTGFGKRFANLDNGENRFGAIADIEASADYLLREGLAAPGRLGIMGGSYGGYMTIAGLTHYPNLFAASVDLFGIVNFETFFVQSEPSMGAISTIEYGHPAQQADLLARLSPIHSLDRIQAALMVQHGANDTNVPVIEAEQIVSSMKKRGRPVEYVSFPDEGHGFRKIENRVRSVLEFVSFFEKHLKATARR